MSMSIDYERLERVYAFADFLNLLAKPEEFKSLLNDFKAQSEVLKKAVQEKTKTDSVDNYVIRRTKELEKEEDQLSLKEKEFEAFVQKETEAIRQQSAEVARLRAEVSELKATRTKELEEAQKQNAEATTIRSRLEAQLADVEKAREELRKDQAALAEKQEQLKKVFGG